MNGLKRKSPESDQNLFKKPAKFNNASTSKNEMKHHLMVQECSNSKARRFVNFHSLDSYTKHKMLINYYLLTHSGSVSKTFTRDLSNDKSDYDVLLENHKFIWDEDDLDNDELTWGQRVAKKYYDKLFKEYCIIDLSRFDENKFGMRWRTENEVVDGKGQFICGAKKCFVRGGLTSWEVLFTYVEHNIKQSALVKVRLCPECSRKLNYHRTHRKIDRKSKKSKQIPTEKRPNENVDNNEKLIEIKEEIVTDDENEITGKNYDELIEKIWRQPVKMEQDDDTEQALENDVDEYLNQLFC